MDGEGKVARSSTKSAVLVDGEGERAKRDGAGGTLFAAFSRTNAPPQLWMGKTVCDLPVSNGYITALAVELIKK